MSSKKGHRQAQESRKKIQKIYRNKKKGGKTFKRRTNKDLIVYLVKDPVSGKYIQASEEDKNMAMKVNAATNAAAKVVIGSPATALSGLTASALSSLPAAALLPAIVDINNQSSSRVNAALEAESSILSDLLGGSRKKKQTGGVDPIKSKTPKDIADECIEHNQEILTGTIKTMKERDEKIINEKKLKNNFQDKHAVIKRYIQYLFRYTGEFFCFEKGTFVIRDASFNLFNLLNEQKDYVTNPAVGSPQYEMLNMYKSHTTYLNKVDKKENAEPDKPQYGNIYEVHMYDKNAIVQYGCGISTKETPLKEKFKSNCSGKPYIFTNLKWYPFYVDENENNKTTRVNYIFFKFEKYPTDTAAHLIEWFVRHKKFTLESIGRFVTRINSVKGQRDCSIRNTGPADLSVDHLLGVQLLSEEEEPEPENERKMGRRASEDNMMLSVEDAAEFLNGALDPDVNPVAIDANKKKNCDTRREDEKEVDGVINDPNNTTPFRKDPYRNYSGFILNTEKGEKIERDTDELYVRKGDEFFIPQEVSEYLLDASSTNGKSLKFEYPNPDDAGIRINLVKPNADETSGKIFKKKRVHIGKKKMIINNPEKFKITISPDKNNGDKIGGNGRKRKTRKRNKCRKKHKSRKNHNKVIN
jgi:hypothetical protein